MRRQQAKYSRDAAACHPKQAVMVRGLGGLVAYGALSWRAGTHD